MAKIILVFFAIATSLAFNLEGSHQETCSTIISQVEKGCLAEALCSLENYKSDQGEDALFEAMLVYIANHIKDDDLCYLMSAGEGQKWAELFLKVAEKRTKESIVLQKKSELISRILWTQDPCISQNHALFARAARIFQNVPSVDYVAVLRRYKNIFSLDSCDSQALADMAYAANKAGWIDYASILYCQYFRWYCGGMAQYQDYADVLEAQYNMTRSLAMNERFGFCVGYNDTYWLRTAHIFNYVNFSQHAYDIFLHYLNRECENLIDWGVFSQAAATINHRTEAIYALERAEYNKPGDIETHWAEWLALPPVLSRMTGWANYYHESTTLQNVTEGANYYASKDFNTKYIVGFEAFQTKARPKLITLGGLFRLVGPQDQTTAEVESGWAGIEQLFNPRFITTFCVGAGRSNIAGAHDIWTPMYILNVDSRISDHFNIKMNSGYNFYQISPRASFFKIRRWHSEIFIDILPTYDTEFLTIIDPRIYSDGNKQLEITVYPRYNFIYLEHWKLGAGLMGNWLTTRKDLVHGYYAPSLYQVYAAQGIIEYRVNRHSCIKATGLGGTQKDNFSTFFGPFAQAILDMNLEFSIYWKLRLLGDYLYVKQSGGSFNYLKFYSELTYRF